MPRLSYGELVVEIMVLPMQKNEAPVATLLLQLDLQVYKICLLLLDVEGHKESQELVVMVVVEVGLVLVEVSREFSRVHLPRRMLLPLLEVGEAAWMKIIVLSIYHLDEVREVDS